MTRNADRLKPPSMRRQLNTPLLAFLFFSTAILAVAAFFLHRHMTQRSAEGLLTKAEQAEEKNELEKALEYYERYLSFKPTDITKTAEYGLLIDRYSNSLDEAEEAKSVRRRALNAFEKVLRSADAPTAYDHVRKALVDIVVNTARNPDQFLQADPHIRQLVANAETSGASDAEKAKLYGQRGQIMLGQLKYEEAKNDLKKSIELNPAEIDSYLPLANTLRQLGAAEEADQVMNDLIANNPKEINAYLARSVYRLQNKRFPEAREDAAQAIELAARSLDPAADRIKANRLKADSYLLAANVELLTPNMEGNLNDARGWLEKAIELAPKRKEFYLALSELEERAANPGAAETALSQGIKQIPKSYDLAFLLANSYIEHDKPALARPIIQSLRAEQLPKPPIDLLEARALVAEGQWLEAIQRLESIRPSLEGETYNKMLRIAADMDLARCYRERREGDKEIAAYRRVLLADPDYTPATLNLAAAIVRQAPGDEARAAEAGRLLQGAATSLEGQLFQARLRASNVLRLPPRQRNWSQVLQELDALEKQAPNRPEVMIPVTLMRSEIDLEQGRLEAARKRLSDARLAHADDPAYWIAEARFNQQIKQFNAAIDLLDEADRKFGHKSPELFAARVEFWTRSNEQMARPALINLIPRLKELPTDRQDPLAEYLAQALARAGAPKEALALVKSIAAKDTNANAPRSQAVLFDFALRANDDAQASAAVDALKRIEGNQGIQWRLADAAFNVAKFRRDKTQGKNPDPKRLETARQRINEVRGIQPTSPRATVLEADIARLEGDDDAAIAALEKAVEQGERSTPVVRELVQLYYGKKRYKEADEIIHRLEQQGVLESDLKRIAAQVSLGVDDKEQALRLAAEAVSPDSADYRDHVWLGQIRASSGDDQGAEAAFEKAVQIAPTAPEAWLSLVQFLIRQRRAADAENALKRAQTALPPSVASIALARGYRIVGRNDLAEALFDKAVADNPADLNTLRDAAGFYLTLGRVERADSLLKSIADNNAFPKQDRAAARRTLAAAIFEAGLSDRMKDALELVDANLKEKPDSENDSLLKGMILTAFPGRRSEAVALLETLGAGNKTKSNDIKFLLAQLQDSEGNWDQAKTLFQEAIAANPENPKIQLAYLKALVRREQFDEADRLVQNLEKLNFSSLQLLSLKANLLKRQGKADQAVAIVQNYANENPAQARGVAELLERLGDSATAEALFKQAAENKDKPENLLALASFYGRQNRPQEAIDLCDAARQTSLSIDRILATAFSAMSVSPLSPELLQRVESWIDEAEKTHGKDKYQNHRALFLTLAGRRKDAEDLYRKAIAVRSDDIMALNNLAWLIAQTGGDAEEALTLINRAISAVGFNHALVDTRAIVQLARQRPDLAIADLRRVIDTQPEPSYYFHLARALAANKETKAAAAALNNAHALGLKPADVDILEQDAYKALVDTLDSFAENTDEPIATP